MWNRSDYKQELNKFFQICVNWDTLVVSRNALLATSNIYKKTPQPKPKKYPNQTKTKQKNIQKTQTTKSQYLSHLTSEIYCADL